MFDLFVTPGAPYFALSAAGAFVAAAGLLRLEQARLLLAGVRSFPTRRGLAGRFMLGQAAAAPIVLVLLMTLHATAAQGTQRWLLLGLALLLWLYLGLVLPRKPIVQAQQQRRALRSLTPGFVNYLRVSMAGYDPPVETLTRYARRPDKRRAPMQAVVGEALTMMTERRTLPFESLRIVARARGCQELIDVADSLAQAEEKGTNPSAALAAHETTLLALLDDEFKRLLKRRTMYLLLLVALSVVVGILGNLLWTMAISMFVTGGINL